jgi:hypothetical protein
MNSWKRVLAEGTIAGSVASVLSTVALVVTGQRENGYAAAPVNAISHWIWDRPALHEDRASWRHTVPGYLVHHGASIFWATLHALAWGCSARAKRTGPALAGATAAAALACAVDYRVAPARLTPGFEHRLSTGSMLAVYACFALGLAAGSIAAGRICGKFDGGPSRRR